MNWARGLFRFWILFAGFWIAACIAYSLIVPVPMITYELQDKNSEKFEVVAPTGKSASDVVDFLESTRKMNRPECAPEKRGPWCDTTTKLSMPTPIKWTVVIAAAAVPLAVLILGAALTGPSEDFVALVSVVAWGHGLGDPTPTSIWPEGLSAVTAIKSEKTAFIKSVHEFDITPHKNPLITSFNILHLRLADKTGRDNDVGGAWRH
jgi:hypothetical protein